MRCAYRNKNGAHVWGEGRLPFFRFAHAGAYTPRSTRKGVLISSLLRMDDNCTTRMEVVASALELQEELRQLSYPTTELRDAARRVSALRPGGAWDVVVRVLDKFVTFGW